MNFQARIIEIQNTEQALLELSKIHADKSGIIIMKDKAVFKTIKIENISAKDANLLKQTFLAKGGEVAVARETAALSIPYTDVLICATLKQYKQALAQLQIQPWGLPAIAKAIGQALLMNEQFPVREYSWNQCSLSIKPGKALVMGILNITPDSFSDGGRYNSLDNALYHLEEMIANGADIIDIGAESTRPYNGSQKISTEEEMQRLLPILEKVLAVSSVPVSIDTYKSSVAREALKLGAHMINDVWGLQYDVDMAKIIAEYNVPLIVMHNQQGTDYSKDIMFHICSFLQKSIDIGLQAGIDFNNFIIDPGIGFGKNYNQNLMVTSRLEELKALGCPILLGTSRKRFIGDTLDLPVEQRLEGTAATVAVGVMKGCNIFRVHDVKEISRIVKMTEKMNRSE